MPHRSRICLTANEASYERAATALWWVNTRIQRQPPLRHDGTDHRLPAPVEESGDDDACNKGSIVCGIDQKVGNRTKTFGAIRCDRKVADVRQNSYQHGNC